MAFDNLDSSKLATIGRCRFRAPLKDYLFIPIHFVQLIYFNSSKVDEFMDQLASVLYRYHIDIVIVTILACYL